MTPNYTAKVTVIALLVFCAGMGALPNANALISPRCASLFGWGPKPAKRTFDFTLNGQNYSLPLHNREELTADEPQEIARTVQIFNAFFAKQYPHGGVDPRSNITYADGQTRRGVHPSSHGTLRGTLVVNPDLPEKYRVGIFAKPSKSFDVITRFSNGSPRPGRPDQESDTRGFALRVLGVSGTPVLQNLKDDLRTRGQPDLQVGVQDIMLNSSPTFFADIPKTYNEFLKISLLKVNNFAQAVVLYLAKVALRPNLPLAFRIFKAFQGIQSVKAHNPLDLKYFSILPSQFGAGPDAPVVKYKIEPVSEENQYVPVDEKEPFYLREALTKTIASNPIAFRLMIQVGDQDASVEDPTRPWPESSYPWIEVARVTFPKQDLVDEEVADKLAFNEWNSLDDLRPIGGINRMRLVAYLNSAAMRRKMRRQQPGK